MPTDQRPATVCEACESAAKVCEEREDLWSRHTSHAGAYSQGEARECADAIRSACRHLPPAVAVEPGSEEEKWERCDAILAPLIPNSLPLLRLAASVPLRNAILSLAQPPALSEEVRALVEEGRSAIELHRENNGSKVSGGWETDARRLAKIAIRLCNALSPEEK